MSSREELQNRLVSWIETWATAPYGVIAELRDRENGPGKARVITFGLTGTLDASLFIWSTKRLELSSSRTDVIERFDNEDRFVQYCVDKFGVPELKRETI